MAVGSTSGVVGVMSAHFRPLWLRYGACILSALKAP
ncbi:MAG: hypothetical protein QOE78_548, partial [Alphaproteobacteria bacterium]|nr:hypothetical protein [Alphaproteobacteria bacterium]